LYGSARDNDNAYMVCPPKFFNDNALAIMSNQPTEKQRSKDQYKMIVKLMTFNQKT
jgi:hypothetical protein